MGEWATRAELEADVGAGDVWRGAYADAAAWPRWNPELASARLDGPLRLGAQARVRFGTGLRLTFRVVEFEDGRLFTDEARLPGARMGHRHELEALGPQRTRLRNTIYVRGPLSWLWARVVGRRAAAALPDGQRAIVALAR